MIVRHGEAMRVAGEMIAVHPMRPLSVQVILAELAWRCRKRFVTRAQRKTRLRGGVHLFIVLGKRSRGEMIRQQGQYGRSMRDG